MMMDLRRVPTFASNQADIPVAASSAQLRLRSVTGVQISRSRHFGGFLSLGYGDVMWSKSKETRLGARRWQWQPVIAASDAGGESVGVSGTRARPFRILVLSL